MTPLHATIEAHQCGPWPASLDMCVLGTGLCCVAAVLGLACGLPVNDGAVALTDGLWLTSPP